MAEKDEGTISIQQETPDNEQEPTLEAPTLEQSEADGQTEGIPEKLLGKSYQDVVNMYLEVEREKGRLGTEVGEARKAVEDANSKVAQYEQYFGSQSRVTESQEAEVPDPAQILETEFDDDPKKAMIKAERARQQREQYLALQRRALEADQFYTESKQKNPDYARREPLMQRLVIEFADIIDPSHRRSAKALRALDLMSKGADIEYYEQQAVEKARKDGLSVRQEKKQAHSESPSSEGDIKISAEKMSREELRKILTYQNE